MSVNACNSVTYTAISLTFHTTGGKKCFPYIILYTHDRGSVLRIFAKIVLWLCTKGYALKSYWENIFEIY